jgi:hypothetical protein
MRGLPLLWESFVESVCWNLFHSLKMVLWLTFRVCATSFWDSPVWRRPIVIPGLRRISSSTVRNGFDTMALDTEGRISERY